jgi:subtilisin family serine protease
VAGIIAAQDGAQASLSGLAPAAMVVPIRVVTNAPDPRPGDVATAIQVAVSTGAQVISLALRVDLNQPVIAAAVIDAVRHNVVVSTVAPAPVGSGAVPPTPPAGVLRVGAIAVDDRALTSYRANAVDVVAPGVNVMSLGISGVGPVQVTGTDYAVAFVAGLAALVRGAHPDLSAEQVAHRIEVTADAIRSPTPDPQTGWGMINPGAAVNRVLPEEQPTAGSPRTAGPVDTPTGSGRGVAIAVLVVLCLLAVFVVVVRVRRMVRLPSAAPAIEAPEAPVRTAATVASRADSGWRDPG